MHAADDHRRSAADLESALAAGLADALPDVEHLVDGHVAAMVAADADAQPVTEPSRSTTMITSWLRLKAAKLGATGIAALATTGGLAHAGELPAPIQDAVSGAVAPAGIAVPTAAEAAADDTGVEATDPSAQEAGGTVPAEGEDPAEDVDATDPSGTDEPVVETETETETEGEGGKVHPTNHGAEVSAVAHQKGEDHGQRVSAVASANGQAHRQGHGKHDGEREQEDAASEKVRGGETAEEAEHGRGKGRGGDAGAEKRGGGKGRSGKDR